MKRLKAIVLGFGMRGEVYSKYAIDHPEELEIIAVAEPVAAKRTVAKKLHNLSDENIYEDWKDLLNKPKSADFVIIATQDNMHFEPAIECINQGYNILLEKPIAPTAKECKIIAQKAKEKGVKIIVCHVLRFTSFFKTIKDFIDSDKIGEVMSVIHMENVGHTHQSHSFVRGNWRNSKESSPMILAKSCHDTDILQWLIGKKCKKIQSFGSLSYFTPKNRPQGAPDYCINGCPKADTCFYNAVKLYAESNNEWFRGVAANKENPTDEEVIKAITDGPYGRCVFNCDNDVVDHQVVNMEFEGGATVSFTMNAFNAGGRFIRIFGTKGELIGAMGENTIKIFTFEDGKNHEYSLDKIGETITSGHGGGDTNIMKDLIRYFSDDVSSKSICDIETSYLNHLISFAAEESRINGKIIDMDSFEERI